MKPRRVVIEHGYELCAVCGKELLNGDAADVLNLGDDYRSYTHPRCSKKAFPLPWRKASRAEDSRKFSEPAREARFVRNITLDGSSFGLMSLLSDKQIETELAPVTKYQKEAQLPKASVCKEKDEEICSLESGPKGERWNGNVYQDLRNSGLLSIGRVDLLSAAVRHAIDKVEQDIVQEERARTYWTGRPVFVDPAIVQPAFVGTPDERTSVGKEVANDD